MITLRNKLYESLLDDEEKLVDDDSVIKNLADKIFKGYKYNIENDGKVSFFGPLTSTSIATKDIIKDIFSGEYLTHFKRFSSISLDRFNIYKYFKNPVYTDKIDHLYISTDSLVNLKNNDINIKEVNELEINISIENEEDWMGIFQDTKIKTLLIKPIYSSGINMKNIPPISGLNADKVIIDNNIIPGYEIGFFNKMDWDKIDEYINFIKSHNKVKTIYIIDNTESTRVKFYNRYIKIKKIK